jgi:hypothetical protein
VVTIFVDVTEYESSSMENLWVVFSYRLFLRVSTYRKAASPSHMRPFKLVLSYVASALTLSI